ncbi:aspartate--tRNA ligase [Sesbania bispinosa]|nr:aspartate--tRNA ligase [Sesbania bispinosa]
MASGYHTFTQRVPGKNEENKSAASARLKMKNEEAIALNGIMKLRRKKVMQMKVEEVEFFLTGMEAVEVR